VGSGQDSTPAETQGNYLTIPDAAKYLGKCTKTVKVYIQHGLLRANRIRGRGRRLWIRREDVKALKELHGQRFRTADLKDLVETVHLRLYSIEHKLDFLMYVNGLNVSSLRDSHTEDLLAIYDEVCEFIDLNSFDIPHDKMVEWAKLLLQLTELEFSRLIKPTQDMKPWRPFYQLCVHLMKSLRRKKGFAHHPKMQQAYRLLEKARKGISQAALIFEETHAGMESSKRVAKVAGFGMTEDSLDRYIEAELRKHRPS
jgi:excisionase family DNA binding protein